MKSKGFACIVSLCTVFVLALVLFPAKIPPVRAAAPASIQTEGFETLADDLTGSIFYNVLFSKADKDNQDTADKVINGNRSLLYPGNVGFNQFAISHEQLFTGFQANSVYIINFLLKPHTVIPEGAQILFYADSLEGENVPAMYVKMQDGKFQYVETTNGFNIEAGEVKNAGDGIYSVTLRYKTIANPTKPVFNLRFAVNTATAFSFSFDDLTIWAAQEDTPLNEYHPFVQTEESNPTTDSTTGTSESTITKTSTAPSTEGSTASSNISTHTTAGTSADLSAAPTAGTSSALDQFFKLLDDNIDKLLAGDRETIDKLAECWRALNDTQRSAVETTLNGNSDALTALAAIKGAGAVDNANTGAGHLPVVAFAGLALSLTLIIGMSRSKANRKEECA